jgi:diaminopimelate decarboxylase
VEPGRSIIGNATLLITRVRAVHRRWAFLDASHNYLGENPYLFTRMILPCRQHADRPTAIYHLSGSTLNTLDVIDAGCRLPCLEPGDLLALCDAGAYSISRANRYAGITPPIYLLRSDGDLECIRRPGDAEDLTTLMTGGEKITQTAQ